MINTDFKLHENSGIPIIENITELTKLIQVKNIFYTFRYSFFSDEFYEIKNINKKSGGNRLIHIPCKVLKRIQRLILDKILTNIRVSKSCKGFVKGFSTLDNALPHVGAKTILSMDIKNFFPSISSKQVYFMFKKIGYNNLISTILTNFCTCEDSLPQGSPCSPMIANLVTYKLDLRIENYLKNTGITYTRYADDLTFSGNNRSQIIYIKDKIIKIIEEENFCINSKKTRISTFTKPKIVTGLIITNEKVGIGKKKYKELRAKIHHLTKSDCQSFYLSNYLLPHVQGWLSYLKSVDFERYLKVCQYVKQLSIKYNNSMINELIIN